MALLTFSDKLGDEEIKILPSLLGKICNSMIMVVYHSMNHAILHMETQSYMLLGDMIVKERGLKIQNMIVTHLEGTCHNLSGFSIIHLWYSIHSFLVFKVIYSA